MARSRDSSRRRGGNAARSRSRDRREPSARRPEVTLRRRSQRKLGDQSDAEQSEGRRRSTLDEEADSVPGHRKKRRRHRVRKIREESGGKLDRRCQQPGVADDGRQNQPGVADPDGRCNQPGVADDSEKDDADSIEDQQSEGDARAATNRSASASAADPKDDAEVADANGASVSQAAKSEDVPEGSQSAEVDIEAGDRSPPTVKHRRKRDKNKKHKGEDNSGAEPLKERRHRKERKRRGSHKASKHEEEQTLADSLEKPDESAILPKVAAPKLFARKASAPAPPPHLRRSPSPPVSEPEIDTGGWPFLGAEDSDNTFSTSSSSSASPPAYRYPPGAFSAGPWPPVVANTAGATTGFPKMPPPQRPPGSLSGLEGGVDLYDDLGAGSAGSAREQPGAAPASQEPRENGGSGFLIDSFLGDWRDTMGNNVQVNWAKRNDRFGQLEVQLSKPGSSRPPVKLNVKDMGAGKFNCGHYDLDVANSDSNKIVWIDHRSVGKVSKWSRL